MARLIQTFLRRDTYLETNLEIYQSIRSYAIRKGMKAEERKYFESCLGLLMEGGFMKKLYRDPPNETGIKLEKQGGQDGFVHYSGLQDYIAKNTKVGALRFEKLDYLVRTYFAFATSALLLNLAYFCAKKVGIQRIWPFQAKLADALITNPSRLVFFLFRKRDLF